MEVTFFLPNPHFRKSQIIHFWCDFDQIWIDCFSPGVFCNVHIFAYYLVEFRSIQEKCTDVAIFSPTIITLGQTIKLPKS